MTAPLSLSREEAARGESRKAALLRQLLEPTGVDCEARLPSGEVVRCGSGDPRFRIVFHSDRALSRGADELALGRAYVEGEMDIEGDMLSVLEARRLMRNGLPGLARLQWLAHFLTAPTRINQRSIAFHYNFGDDLYHSFLDTRYHFYSQVIFHDESDSLEQAAERKVEQISAALDLKPGMRLLDIGGGWGGMTRYFSPRGVHVTSLTLAPDSQRYITRLIAEERLDGEVHLQDFLEHRPARPYDAIVICGVIEHIPTYGRFWAQAWECLKPGGLLYLDASASKEKYDMGAFTRRYIWHGTHTYLCLQDLLQEALWHGWEVVRVRQETRDYELTIHEWARRLDENRDFIVERWGEAVYRAFRLYLWGGTHAFHEDRLQAYHVVARRRPEPGLRPGVSRRVRNFVRGLRR